MPRSALKQPLTIALAMFAAALLAGCGESKEEKALNAVCSAKAGIETAVGDLKAITPATFTSQQVQNSIQSIRDDLSTIQENVPALSDSARQQVQTANQQFRSELTAVAAEILKTLSAQDAATKLQQSFTDLAAAYEQAYASVQCPS
ncbi:MAG: hypothetical protein HZB14_06260 [Actinobacteria bacterium]|nr:hypothetical protein [Actinomycetota bacterium]